MRTHVIWSIEHHAWWRPGSMGYSATLEEAGLYTLQEAREIVQEANVVAFHECLIPIAALAGADALVRLGKIA